MNSNRYNQVPQRLGYVMKVLVLQYCWVLVSVSELDQLSLKSSTTASRPSCEGLSSAHIAGSWLEIRVRSEIVTIKYHSEQE